MHIPLSFCPSPQHLKLALVCSSVVVLASCQHNQSVDQPRTTATVPSAALFEDVAQKSGLKFTHVLGDTGKFYFDEFTPSGCALFDYDNDGYLDVFLVQSGSSSPASTVINRPLCALYHNRGDGTFQEVTTGSGLDKDLGYAQGVAVGDYDNDGFDDLFITSYGGNHLFRNIKGKGKFEDVTHIQDVDKVHGSGYATSAAWGDYDRDGLLDLYVCYYAKWSHALNKDCRDDKTGEIDYCRPQIYSPETHQLFHNTGHGFEDVSDKSGISKARGRGLAVAFVDYNGDGKQDIFVANDVTPNMLWKNNGNGTFSNTAQQSGCAYEGRGQDMASMGIGIADYDRSGSPSLYVSNFSNRPNILFKNTSGIFEDATAEANLSLVHLKFLSFGCEFIDYDADGWSDVVVNNGHVQALQNRREADVGRQQRKQLLHNEGRGRFQEVTDVAQLGSLSQAVIGRGLATGDFDNDGRVDVLAMSQNGPAQLLHNQTESNGNHFVSLRLEGTKSNRDAIGTRIELEAGGAKQTAWVRGGSSYLSSSDRRLFFGLGKATKIARLAIVWPNGQRENVSNIIPDTFVTIIEGKGLFSQNTPHTLPTP